MSSPPPLSHDRSAKRPARTPAARTSRRRLLADRIGRWAITAGGGAIILSVLGILVFIVIEVAPLAGSAQVAAAGSVGLPGRGVVGILADEYRTHVVVLDEEGVARAVRLADGATVGETHVFAGGIFGGMATGTDLLSAGSPDGMVGLVPVRFETSYEADRRAVTPRIGAPIVLQVGEDGQPVAVHAARLDRDDGTATVAGVLPSGDLAVVRREARTNPITGEVTQTSSRVLARAPRGITHLVFDAEQRNLYGGTSDGHLAWWRLADGIPREPQVVPTNGAAVTALTLLLGDRSLVVGQADGSVSVFSPVRQGDESSTLTRMRTFRGLRTSIRWIAPSWRDRGFLVQDDGGRLLLCHSTSERILWRGTSPSPAATAAFVAPKVDGAFLAGGGRLTALELRNPHPESSLRSFFARVWYEGYERPAFVWQSTGGTDDFEPKLSLTPLIAGTLKGTFFSLILAIPLGVLGAMYASQFMHPDLKKFVKPTVEIMAALPSVVLGFLAGLWLAPRLERLLPALLLMPVVLTAFLLGARLLWHALPRRIRARIPLGSELGLYVLVLVLGSWLCLVLSPWLEAGLFQGSFPTWLLHATGLAYDQRNAVVVGLAMGFAVIPIIFAIAEDAFSNVPRDLVSGSLALGASLWQTVTRVVLPTASPGIFSAIMVGFGRAVGETMIVLMATGNTPIMDWNPFNGFRTLSANIAVEIPEAPQGGTLYRTLFLAALLLFVITFLVNTAAEVVRQRLRRRYAQL